jgi:hypothetical protein
VIAASGDLLQQLPLSAACAVLELGRGSYYRAQGRSASEAPRARGGSAEEEAVQEATERIVLEFSGYGYLRVTHQLRREGFRVNPKRVYRLMQEGGWLHLRRRGTVRTTDSEHGFPVYPNLLAERGWRALTRPNQAWGADLTYVRLEEGFCYLAVLLDLFSRRIVGWDLSESLEASGALAALEMALSSRQPEGGWIHHSDRGIGVPACGSCLPGVRAAAEASWGAHQHGSSRRAEGECADRAVDADGQRRGGGSGRVSQLQRGQTSNQPLYRGGLQPKAATLGVGIPAAERVRGDLRRRHSPLMCVSA